MPDFWFVGGPRDGKACSAWARLGPVVGGLYEPLLYVKELDEWIVVWHAD